MDYLILVSSIVLGALTVFGFKLHEPKHVKLLNSFTGAFLLSLTLLHLLPELYSFPRAEGGHEALLLGTLMLAGFFVQLALDFISMGVEHGHSHHLHGHAPYGVVAGLCVHALVEGMGLGNVDDLLRSGVAADCCCGASWCIIIRCRSRCWGCCWRGA